MEVSNRLSSDSSQSTMPLSDDTAVTSPIDRILSRESQRNGSISQKSPIIFQPGNAGPDPSTAIPEEPGNVAATDALMVNQAEVLAHPMPSEMSDLESLIDGDSWNDLGNYTSSKDLEIKSQSAKSYVKQSAQYTRLIETRLQYLEQWVKTHHTSKDESELFSELDDRKQEKAKYGWGAEDFSDDQADPNWTMEQLVEYYEPDIVPQVNRAFRDQLRLFHGSKFAIDVPLEDSDAGIQTHVWPAQTKRRNARKSKISSKARRPLPTVGYHRLSKIRINSKPIRQALLQMPKVHFMDPIVIAPFKTLFCNEEKMRAYLHELERVANSSTDPVTDPSNSGSQACSIDLNDREGGLEPEGHRSRLGQIEEDPNNPGPESNPFFENMKDIAKAKVTLPHWRCLVELLDKDLKYLQDLRRDIELGTVGDILFQDAWHLFSPGDLIITKETGYLQALRVLSSTGGRRLIDARVRESDWGEAKGPTTYTEDWLNPHESTDYYSPLVINCYHLDFDGRHFGPVQVDIKIEPYKGTKPVTKLPIYPAQFHGKSASGSQDSDMEPHSSEILNKLKERGQRFCELCPKSEVCHMQYQGMSLDEVPDFIDSPIIIDPREAYLQNPKGTSASQPWTPSLGLSFNAKPDAREWCEPATSTLRSCTKPRCTLCRDKYELRYAKYEDFGVEEIRVREFMKDKPLLTERKGVKSLSGEDAERDIMTLPPRLFAFALRNRKWIQADIDGVSDIKVDDNNFEKLVLPEGHAKIVKSLVETHLRGLKDSDRKEPALAHHSDIVQGKGTGLVLLLHGAPGVGKTSTAECIAELTRRPLFPITCGDIGDNAADVQRNLEQNFHLAHHWNCVLLLDEADVFLAQRERTDLKRNALVSVFLRVLEYYRGILFLTTNRVGMFDDAFKSRIHLSLYYPPLNRKSSFKVWKMNINEARKRGLEVDERRITKFAKEHFDSLEDHKGPQSTIVGSSIWNGRQIRNAFQTAIALAVWESQNASSAPVEPSEHKKKKFLLRREHFEQVANASYQFEQYLMEVRGLDDAKTALDQGARDDSFRPDMSSYAPWSPRPSRSSVQAPAKKMARRRESDEDSESPSGRERKSGSKSKARGSRNRDQNGRKARRDEPSSESENNGTTKSQKAGRRSLGKSSRRQVSDSDSSSSATSSSE